jgi:putative endopeptidase
VSNADTVIVGQPEFYQTAGKLLKTAPLDDWKTYLTWQLTRTFAATLSQPFVQENFYFYGTVLRGAKAMRPRWKRVLDMQEDALGDALGQLFVKEYFKPKTKARYDTLVKNVVSAFAEHIQQVDWMSAPTKVVALDKLRKITPKVGYPDKWKDYSALKIDRSSLAANVMRANQWQYNYELNKLGKPVDRTEWGMTPQTYNAYYNGSKTRLCCPRPPSRCRACSTPTPTMRWCTATPGPAPSATSSPTASTTRAASTTPTATCTSGGAKKTVNALISGWMAL